MSRSRRPLPLALVLALALFLTAVPALHAADAPATTARRAAAPELARFNDLLAGLAESLQPGLVHVRVRRAASEEGDGERRATGSGFVIDGAGLIVTNAHVVEGASAVQVRLHDGRRFNARVIGRDNRVDLALLKVDNAANLVVLPLGDSNRLRVGEFVLALGHQYGLEYSVSFGIVSRKGAPLTVAAPQVDFIQTDAVINPGNSGGPLVNMAGEVVGVNSMALRNGSIGFAIPINLVRLLVPQLEAKGTVEWGWLGVSITEVSDDDLDRLKLTEARGVLVRSVLPGEPAEKGGVKANDVIVAIDDARLEGPRDLQRIVASTPVGTKVRVVVMRDGKPTEVEVEIGRYKAPETPPRIER
ncbi:MAG: trypsin-like peptidase domain-containing protein [Candidatus Rokubacteria bacterium]|nr:trypsin-like peptidase domain-containing protein [Candidatus Rokubacteria bacterium]